MKALLTFGTIAVIGAMTTVSAATVVGNVGDDAAFATYMNGFPGFNLPVDYTQEVFAAQARIGNNQTNGTNEIGLHRNNPADATPPTNSSPEVPTVGDANLVWGTAGGGNATFKLELKRLGITISFRLFQGSPLSPTTTYYAAEFDDSNAANVSLLDFRTAATASSTISLTNLILTQGSTTTTGFDSTTSGTVRQNVVVKDLIGDFVLAGDTTLNWTGSAPTNSGLSWQIKAFRGLPSADSAVPEPGTIGMALSGAAMILLARRRLARV